MTRRILLGALALTLISNVGTHAADPPAGPIIVDLTVKGTLSEAPSAIGLDGVPATENLKALLDRIGKAKVDTSVKGLLLRLRKVTAGRGKIHELHHAIRDFRESGKPVYAFLEMADTSDYLIATAADEIVMPESGWLMLKGMAAEVTFYKGLFDKLGVKADMMQVGEFKGAGEPYTRTEMSGPFREELTSILNDNYLMLAEAISKRQGISVDDAKALLEGGPYTPADAKMKGLVNRIGYADQIETEIAKLSDAATATLDPKYGRASDKPDMGGLTGFLKMMQALSGETAKKPSSDKPKIAIIHAEGMIQEGKSTGGSLLGESVMGSDTVIKDLRKAEKDPTVKAIVLRVDSPGGSALASDLIWREVTRIEKPIVASMSDVAASGGYYISMGADKILAEPGTLTGSIGVVGGKVALGGLMEKFGVTTDTITVGKNATMFSNVSPFSDEERAAMQRLMKETYNQFVTKAAKGRNMTAEALEKLARGRVYTGRQAKALGLVDEVGTVKDALAEAKSLAGLNRDAETELLILPEPQGLLESLFAPLDGRDVRVATLLPEPLQAMLGKVDRIGRLLNGEPSVLLMPFEVRIR